MGSKFRKLRRRCERGCSACKEELCPLMSDIEKNVALKKLHRSGISVYFKMFIMYLIGIALVAASVILIIRPDVINEVVVGISFKIRAIVAIVATITGGGLMTIAQKIKVDYDFDKLLR